MSTNTQILFDDLLAEGYGNVPDATMRAALRQLYGKRRWKFLEGLSTALSATVANQGIVGLSALAGSMTGTNIKLDSVRISFGTDYRGDGEMEPTDSVKMKDMRHTDRTPGFPRKWARIHSGPLLTQNEVWVWPIPDTTYPLSISYYNVPALPTTAGDSMIWPEEQVEVVEALMVMKLTSRMRDSSSYDRAKARYDAAYADAVADDNVQDRQGDDQVERWSGWDLLS